MSYLLSFFTFLLIALSPQCADKKISLPPYPIVVLETTAGSMEILLFPDVAPKACENFIKLAQKGFYDGTVFHRIIKNFIIQGGDPTGTGKESTSIFGETFEDEFSDEVLFDAPGKLGIASSGPNTNGSQFFITVIETPWLNKKHTAFGQVIKGFKTIKALESCGSHAGYVSPVQSIIRMYVKSND